jgi:PAS domain S-box-containing protein
MGTEGDGPDALTAVRAAAREVPDAGNRQEAARRAVSVLAEDVGAEHACVYLRNDSPSVLYASARTDAFEEHFDVDTVVDEEDGLVGHAVSSGDPVVGNRPDDPPTAAGLDDAGGWCLVPLGGEGVLVAVTPDETGFDPGVVADVDLVGAYLEAGLARHAGGDEMADVARLEALSRAFPDYAFLYDADGRYLDVLLGWTNIQLYRRQELLGSTVHDVMEPDVAETVHGAITDALETGEIQVIEYGVDTPGGVYWYESRAVPVEDGPDAERVVLVARDISERHQREAALQRKNERLEEFTSIASHDLRNPLNVASANVEIARDTGDLSVLDDIQAAHDRMEELIADLLTLAREGRTVEGVEPVRADRLCESAWDAVNTGDADLVAETDETTVMADGARLRQLLENLIRNSVEHGSADGVPVTVRFGVLDDGFYLEDDGPGIPEGEREAVFEPGYSDGGGTGIGLNIVQRVAEAHGWDVTVTDPDGDGARFEITGVERADAGD